MDLALAQSKSNLNKKLCFFCMPLCVFVYKLFLIWTFYPSLMMYNVAYHVIFSELPINTCV